MKSFARFVSLIRLLVHFSTLLKLYVPRQFMFHFSLEAVFDTNRLWRKRNCLVRFLDHISITHAFTDSFSDRSSPHCLLSFFYWYCLLLKDAPHLKAFSFLPTKHVLSHNIYNLWHPNGIHRWWYHWESFLLICCIKHQWRYFACRFFFISTREFFVAWFSFIIGVSWSWFF